VLHRVKVRREWLARGEVIELELPRNLACAACGGGGCDKCGRSGAITLRQRDELAEVVEITLPARAAQEAADSQGVTLRIPEQGGLPEPGSDLPRGLLLLTVVPGPEADPRIKLLRGVVSKRPPASVVESAAGSLPPEAARKRRLTWLILGAAVVTFWILLLIWLRLSGRG
jgi:hypothetical protein